MSSIPHAPSLAPAAPAAAGWARAAWVVLAVVLPLLMVVANRSAPLSLAVVALLAGVVLAGPLTGPIRALQAGAPTTPAREAVPAGQALGQAQGAGGAAPPAQAWPGGHSAPAGEVEPAPQPLPGSAAQGPEQAGVVRPLALP